MGNKQASTPPQVISHLTGPTQLVRHLDGKLSTPMEILRLSGSNAVLAREHKFASHENLYGLKIRQAVHTADYGTYFLDGIVRQKAKY